jgi:hypothetical protein
LIPSGGTFRINSPRKYNNKTIYKSVLSEEKKHRSIIDIVKHYTTGADPHLNILLWTQDISTSHAIN